MTPSSERAERAEVTILGAGIVGICCALSLLERGVRWRYLPSLLPWTWKFLKAGRSDRVPAIAEAMNALTRPSVELYRHYLETTQHEGLVRDAWYIHAYRDAAPNYQRARVFARLAKRLLPDLNTADTREWMGVRPSFPDSLPCIGEAPGLRGLYAAFGHSHYGLSMAPATGEAIARLVTGQPSTIDLRPYRMDRFS